MRYADCHPDRKHHCLGMCKPCYKSQYEKNRRASDPEFRAMKIESSKKWHQAQGPEYRFDRWLKRQYGITIADYYDMLTAQGGRCAVCRTDDPCHGRLFFCVDHDHLTNEVRGLLCDDCNLAAGKMKDDPVLLIRLADYLKAGGYVAD